MKVVTVLGARPQFIKAAAVSRAIRKYNVGIDEAAQIREVLLHTGQHFDANMSAVFFQELEIENPAYHLDIHGGGHGEMTGRMLISIEEVLKNERPDFVLVYGDTNSTLAGALVASKLHIPVAHVEAGLRSFNMTMPEEINRILTDRISSILFCPTESAVQNLKAEGVKFDGNPQVINCGDVMYDVALHHGTRVSETGGILGELAKRHGVEPHRYCLATIHRAENTDDFQRLRHIFEALVAFSRKLPVILPLHPRTRSIVAGSELSAIYDCDSLIVTDPVGYFDMVQLEKHAALITTDSGGVQKEAFFFGVPCVTLRDETEWVELVQTGWNHLAPPLSTQAVLTALEESLGCGGTEVMPYGDGTASFQIVKALAEAGRA